MEKINSVMLTPPEQGCRKRMVFNGALGWRSRGCCSQLLVQSETEDYIEIMLIKKSCQMVIEG